MDHIELASFFVLFENEKCPFGFEIPFLDPVPFSLLGNLCGNPLQTWEQVIALADEKA